MMIGTSTEKNELLGSFFSSMILKFSGYFSQILSPKIRRERKKESLKKKKS